MPQALPGIYLTGIKADSNRRLNHLGQRSLSEKRLLSHEGCKVDVLRVGRVVEIDLFSRKAVIRIGS